MNVLSLNIVTPNGSVYDREDVNLAVLQTTAGKSVLCMDIFQQLQHLKLAMLK